ncbi:MAG TPA: phosphatidylglycerol lysyltransferase domain-containing protein [Gemmatimonadales bacterium]|nr:phosphatidylglycerol lysyltransferase domain-containing protein [Gemmatimonadales bacterium]
MDDAEAARARALVLAHGWNATAFQIVNPGFHRWFSHEGDAVAGLVDYAGVWVVAGAPVAAAERLEAVTREFESDAARAGRQVCYFGAEARLEAIGRRSARHTLVLLGAQPVWDPAGWPERPRRVASLRAQLHRARNKQVEVSEWTAERAQSDVALRTCLAEWLATRGLPPLHFLVEPSTLSRLAARRVFVAQRRGVPIAFLVASPVPARQGWLVEQCVRGAGSVNGTTDLLVDAAMRAFAADGSRFATLGLAPLSRRAASPDDKAPLWLKAALGWVRAHGRRFYNFDGLDQFKARLRPDRWDPVYAIVDRPSFSPRALWAIAGAFSGGSPLVTLGGGLLRAVRWELQGLGVWD